MLNFLKRQLPPENWGLAAVMVAAALGALMTWTLGNIHFWYDDPAFPLHMTRGLLVFILFITLAVGTRVIMLRRAHRSEKRKDEKRETGDNNQATISTVDLSPISNEAKAYREQQKRESYNREHVDTITIVGVAVACGIAYLQWETFEKTDKTLNETIVATNRAWIAPDVNAATVFRKANKGVEIGDTLYFSVTYLNTGKDPALDLNWKFDNGTIESGISGTRTFDVDKIGKMTRDLSCIGLMPKPGGAVAYPGKPRLQLFNSSLDRPPYTVDANVISNDRLYYVRGCVAYRTLNTIVGRSNFCVLFIRPNTPTGSVIDCPEGNTAQ